MIRTVAVGTDGSQTASEAVGMAVEVARRFEAKLVLLSAFQDSGSTKSRAMGSSEEAQWSVSNAARMREILTRTKDELQRQGLECAPRGHQGHRAEVRVALPGEGEDGLLVIGN